MQIAVNELRQKVIMTLRQNFSDVEAEKIAEYLVWADMSGIHTQGILKLTGTSALQAIVPDGPIQTERDTKLSRLIDANKNPAPLVSQIATGIVIEKASEHGIGIVGVRNIFSSNGSQAFYTEKIANHNLIGIMMTRSAASAAGFGGIDPIFGTNPLSFAFPTNEQPVIFDMATSAMTWYGLVLAKAQGKQIPENMAIDKDGNPTIDPSAAMDGALLPFDHGYKGSGLAMAVEMLGGPLVGAAYGQIEGEWGSLMIAIDPEILVDGEVFKANASDLVRKIKAARRAEDVEEIRLPGERAAASRSQAEKTGMVDIDEAVLKELNFL
jgi:L-2-hydroxycarboxylate dehydrogenase (NAD+)